MHDDAPREGFVKTPLWLYDLNAVLSGARWKIIGVISRETYGWGRADAPLTANDIAEAAGLNRQRVSEDLVVLAQIGLVRRTQHGRSFLLGLNPMSPFAVATALDVSQKATGYCRKKRQVIVAKSDRLLSQKATRPIEEDRSGKIGKDPPPPTPATASPGGGGLAPPSEPEPPQPEPHPETLHALTALKITPVVRRELALIAPDVVARTIRACQKIPSARNVAALVVKHLREYLATGDELAPAGACTPTPNDPPPLPDAPTRSADERRALIAARRQERPREIGAL